MGSSIWTRLDVSDFDMKANWYNVTLVEIMQRRMADYFFQYMSIYVNTYINLVEFHFASISRLLLQPHQPQLAATLE
jgi:hypothetical protein